MILSPLGVGGMGEVYRARDFRLGRIVALKVLPERLSQNVELRQRLEHEARTVSKLSHPNICTLYDSGHNEGIDFLVLEFVEGPTLRGLIADGIPSMRNIISIAVQIAEGLSKAHEMGVIHRDLKPENIIVSARSRFWISAWRNFSWIMKNSATLATVPACTRSSVQSQEHRAICHPSSQGGVRSIFVRTSSRSVSCCMNWLLESMPFEGQHRRTRFRPSPTMSPNQSAP